MNYRIKQLLIFLLPVIIISIIILFIKDWNRGSIIINNAEGSLVTIKNNQYKIDNDKYEIEVWPDKYDINIKKIGYFDINKSFQIERGKKINFYPEFIFIPTVQRIYNENHYTIPENNKLISNGKPIYKDNQSEIKYLELKNKTFSNLPNNIFYILFSPNGKKAIIITGNDNLDLFTYYNFNIESEELSVIKKDTILSGLSWNHTSTKITYYEKLDDKQGRIIVYDVNNDKKKEITRLYDIDNMYSHFVLNDSHILILPIHKNKNILLANIKTARKEKLTNSNDIDKMKITHTETGVFYQRNISNHNIIFYLDLETRKLTPLPNQIQNIDTIEILKNNNKILFIKNIKSPIKALLSDDTKSSSIFYTFDLKSWTIDTIQIPNSKNIEIKRFIKLDDTEKNLIIQTTDDKIYRFILS